jgi:hypothetical protein
MVERLRHTKYDIKMDMRKVSCEVISWMVSEMKKAYAMMHAVFMCVFPDNFGTNRFS